MKIVYRLASMGAGVYIGNGIINAMRNLGHEVVACCSDPAPILQSFNPDLFIGSVSFLDDFENKLFEKYPDMKVAAWAHQYNNLRVPKQIMPADTSIKEVELLRKCPNVKAVLCHFEQENAEKYLERWKEIGLKVIGFPPAADIHTYFPVEPVEQYKCQLGYVGGYWKKKAAWFGFDGLDAYFLPLHQKYNFKIYGWGWPQGKSQGAIPFGHDKSVFCSADICPNLHEIHSRYLGTDVVERTFKLPACKAFQVVDRVEEIHKFFKEDEEIVIAGSVQEYHKKIAYYLKHPEEKAPIVEKAYKRVLAEHTYENRVTDFLSKLGGN